MRVGRYEFDIPDKTNKTETAPSPAPVNSTTEGSKGQPTFEETLSKVTNPSTVSTVNNTNSANNTNTVNTVNIINTKAPVAPVAPVTPVTIPSGVSGMTSEGTGSMIDTINQKNELDRLTKSLDAGMTSGDREKLKKVSQEFEEIYINMMLKQMRSGIGSEGGLIEKSFARSMYEDMYFENIAKEVSKGDGFGIGKMMYEQMVRAYSKDEEV